MCGYTVRIWWVSLCIFFFMLTSPFLPAEELHEKRPDLSLSNFFSEGWKFGQWEEPEEEPDQSPRFRLLRIPATVFEREIRLNYSFTNNGDHGEADEHEWELEVEIPICRRLLLEIEPSVSSVSPHKEHRDRSGFGDTALITKLMLLETRNTTLISILETKFPTGNDDRELGSGMTTLGPGIGIWRDLGNRFALQGFLGLDIPVGGKSEEDFDTEVLYGVALTKTVTSKETPYWGNLTFFTELNGTSEMGAKDDKTVVSVLPGVRWKIGHEVWFMSGIEFPVIERDDFDSRAWISILKDF